MAGETDYASEEDIAKLRNLQLTEHNSKNQTG